MPAAQNSGSTAKFSKTANQWLKNIRASKKYSTYMKYRKIYVQYLHPVFGEYQISKIDESLIVKQLLSRPDFQKRNLSDSTIRCILNVISQILFFGGSNVKTRDIMKLVDRNGKRVVETEIFSMIDQKRLLRFLLTDTDQYKRGIIFCLCTGIRLGEICALENEDIDMLNRTIHIRRTVQRVQNEYVEAGKPRTHLQISDPKTLHSVRTIPISNYLYDILKNHVSNDRYFLSGDRLTEPRFLERKLKNYLQRSGVNIKKFHTLRHTFATNCVAGGMDAKVLSVILGHASVNVTLNRYVHPTEKMKRDQLNKCMKGLFG